MAWTAPKTWAVSEVVTAAMLNTHLRDNLLYLKGSPTFDGGIMVGTATGAGTGQIKAKGYTNNEVLSLESAFVGGTFAQFKNTSSGGRDYYIGSTGSGSGAGVGVLVFYDNTAGLFRGAMDANGNFGFGTTAPQGRLHVVEAISGCEKWEYNGVDGTARTVLPAGSVVYRLMAMFVTRADNGATAVGNAVGAPLIPAGGDSVIDTQGADTLALRVNANGSVDIRRNAGTTRTWKVSLWLLWL